MKQEGGGGEGQRGGLTAATRQLRAARSRCTIFFRARYAMPSATSVLICAKRRCDSGDGLPSCMAGRYGKSRLATWCPVSPPFPCAETLVTTLSSPLPVSTAPATTRPPRTLAMRHAPCTPGHKPADLPPCTRKACASHLWPAIHQDALQVPASHVLHNHEQRLLLNAHATAIGWSEMHGNLEYGANGR